MALLETHISYPYFDPLSPVILSDLVVLESNDSRRLTPIREAMATYPLTQTSQPQHLATTHLDSDSPPNLITTMFGALNRFIARLDAAPEEQASATQGAFGFQVLRNTNAEVALEPWFDFIIGINGRTIVSVSSWSRENVDQGS